MRRAIKSLFPARCGGGGWERVWRVDCNSRGTWYESGGGSNHGIKKDTDQGAKAGSPEAGEEGTAGYPESADDPAVSGVGAWRLLARFGFVSARSAGGQPSTVLR